MPQPKFSFREMLRLERGDLVYIARQYPHEHAERSFGERVRQLRRDAGISQEDFADVCGFARSFMSRIQRGSANFVIGWQSAPRERVWSVN
jgi:ribosome-binding protein aMBF1 (putative translation factor)